MDAGAASAGRAPRGRSFGLARQISSTFDCFGCRTGPEWAAKRRFLTPKSTDSAADLQRLQRLQPGSATFLSPKSTDSAADLQRLQRMQAGFLVKTP